MPKSLRVSALLVVLLGVACALIVHIQGSPARASSLPTSSIAPIDAADQTRADTFWLWADQTEGRHLMACGEVEYPSKDLGYGNVYISDDSGVTWKRTLIDRSTAWVSEESCAYGAAQGQAFFAAGAAPSDIMSGLQWGHLQVYSSSDFGDSWKLASVRRQGWLDWTFLAPPNSQGTPAQPLIIFGNHATTRLGTWSNSRPSSLFSTDAGASFAGPFHATPPAGIKYGGVFAFGSTTLSDGTALFSTSTDHIPTDRKVEYRDEEKTAELFAYSEKDHALRSRAVIVKRTGNGGFWPVVLARGNGTGSGQSELYAAWISADTNSSSLGLATSLDDGHHWQARSLLDGPGDLSPCSKQRLPSNVAVAVNRDGVLALGWVEGSDVIRLALSRDAGRTFVVRTISDYSADESSNGREHIDWTVPFDEDLYSETYYAIVGRGSAESKDYDPSTIGLSVRLTSDEGIHTLALAADGSGIFHAIWSHPGPGPHALWTESIDPSGWLSSGGTRELTEGTPPNSSCRENIGQLHVPNGLSAPKALPSLRDVTASFKVAYPISAGYSRDSGSVWADVSVVNKTAAPLMGRLILVAVGLHSDYGGVSASGSSGHVSGLPYWSLESNDGRDKFAPGAQSKPLRLVFQIRNFHSLPAPFDNGDAAAMHLRIYQAGDSVGWR